DSVAHEAGHELRLVHERFPNGSGGANEYYGGDSTRAPIMGGASNNTSGARGIWWRTNNFTGQKSPQPVEGGLAVAPGGPPAVLQYRADDNTVSSPGLLFFDGNGNVSGTPGGIIETVGDEDPFQFSAITTSATFTIKNASLGGMLAPNVRIYRV